MSGAPSRDDGFIGEGLRFECQRCGRCCMGPGGYVFLAEGEGASIAAHLDMSAAVFFSTCTRRVEGRIALIDAAGGDCRFHAPGGCAIYPVRPRQCRDWPFWFRNLRSREDWERAAAECPGIGGGRLHARGEILRVRDGR